MRQFLLLLILAANAHAAPPPNDNFADRTQLSGSSPIEIGSTVSATIEPGEPQHPYSLGASQWWAWTSPGDGWVTINTTGGEVTPAFAVYTGSALTSLNLVAFSGERCPAYNSRGEDLDLIISTVEMFRVSANETYQLAFSSAVGLGGNFPPQQKTGPGSFQFSLVYSTIEIASPTNGARILSGTPIPININLEEVHEREDLAIELNGVLLPESAYVPLPHDRSDFRLAFGVGRCTLRARFIRFGVIHWSPPVSFVVCPINDDLANAVQLEGKSASIIGDVGLTGYETGEFFHPHSGGGSIWYRWKSQGDGTAQIKLSSGSICVAILVRTRSGALQIRDYNGSKYFWWEQPVLGNLEFRTDPRVEYFLQFSVARAWDEPLHPVFRCDPPAGGPVPFQFDLQYTPATPQLKITEGFQKRFKIPPPERYPFIHLKDRLKPSPPR